ncbi:MAG TPA: hypothetical protein PLA92_03545 [Fimbriimonadaceae bacterium]|nr:hypothetical protein [Fimbriimonadaceae bacterium]
MTTHLAPPKRRAPFQLEPGFYEPAGLWLYGNARLLSGHLVTVPSASGPPFHSPKELDEIERQAEKHVLAGQILVSGIHSPAHQRAAVVPLRWGSPRILVVSGGFYHHLGKELKDEPFRVARLWRYQFDPQTDLVVSRRAPDRAPTFARHNPTVDRLIDRIVGGDVCGCLFGNPEF